jgi:phospholipid/cholesterol/gamma-HCH transport system permease protein
MSTGFIVSLPPSAGIDQSNRSTIDNDKSQVTMLNFLEQTGYYCYFALQSFGAAALAMSRPVDLLVQLHHVLIGSLPLGAVTGVALGVVVWIHFHGAIPPEHVHKVPEFLALAVVVEAAPLGAGLIVAGRTGASLGAELGSMRQTEQIDALEVLGQSPMYKLVGPRVLACMIALPVLTVFIAFISIGSSFLAEMMGGGLSWTQYQNDCLRSLTLERMIPANLKTIIFGYLVGVTGCYFGMNAAGGTEGVGKAATQGVVISIFLVMIANVVLVKLIQMLFS